MAKENLLEELRQLSEKINEIQAKEEPTEEDYKNLSGYCDQVEEINGKLEAEKRAVETMAVLNKPTSKPAGLEQPETGQEDRFESFGHYLQAVAASSTPGGGGTDRRLVRVQEEQRSSGLEASTPSLGGFLIQKDFASGLISKAHETSVLWNKIRKIPISTNANGIKIPGIDETDRANGSRWGGIQMYWLDEGGTKTASKPKFLMIEMDLKKLIGLNKQGPCTSNGILKSSLIRGNLRVAA